MNLLAMVMMVKANPMKKQVKRYTFLLTLVAMIFVLASCTPKQNNPESEQTTIKIGYLPITHAAPLYLEKEIIEQDPERFKNFRLELVRFGSWPDLIDALNAGKIDGASVLVQLAMQAREIGVPIKAVALGHRDGNIVVTAPEIKDPADLRGKTFAIPHKFSTHNILLFQTLKQAGLSEEDLNIVEMAPAEMPAALAQERIAGYAVAEPFGAMSVVLGNGKALLQSEDIWKGSICCVLVLREALIKDKPTVAQEFVAGYAAAGKRAETKDENVKNILRKHMKIDDEVLDLSLKWISYDNLNLDRSSYKELVDHLGQMELSENLPTYDDFVDPTLLAKAE